MKKTKAEKRMSLTRETLVQLQLDVLDGVAGGQATAVTTAVCDWIRRTVTFGGK